MSTISSQSCDFRLVSSCGTVPLGGAVMPCYRCADFAVPFFFGVASVVTTAFPDKALRVLFQRPQVLSEYAAIFRLAFGACSALFLYLFFLLAAFPCLVQALLQFAEPTGSIYIDDVNIASLGLHDVRGCISMIPQDPTLFSGTIRSNIDPFNEHSDMNLWSVIEQVR